MTLKVSRFFKTYISCWSQPLSTHQNLSLLIYLAQFLIDSLSYFWIECRIIPSICLCSWIYGVLFFTLIFQDYLFLTICQYMLFCIYLTQFSRNPPSSFWIKYILIFSILPCILIYSVSSSCLIILGLLPFLITQYLLFCIYLTQFLTDSFSYFCIGCRLITSIWLCFYIYSVLFCCLSIPQLLWICHM